MRSANIATGLATATCILLVGCGGGSGSPSNGAQPSAATTPAKQKATTSAALGCGSAPASMVNHYLGTNVGAPAQNTSVSDVAVCTYTDAAKGRTIIIRFQQGTTPQAFAAKKSEVISQHVSSAPAPVSGVGDEAYSTSIAPVLDLPANNEVFAREGDVQILVTSTGSIAAEGQLINALFG